MEKFGNIYVADFETTTNISDCRVWGWGLHRIISGNDAIKYGNNIDEFFSEIKKLKTNSIIYFHNLKFDGNFIISYLLLHGYEHSREKKTDGTFSTVIDGKGEFYNIKIYVANCNGKIISIEVRDSYKKIPMSISEMPAAFGIEIEKLELNYSEDRPTDHKLTELEKKYIKNDVIILSNVILHLYNHGMNGLTLAADAMKIFRKMVGKNFFNNIFGTLPIDADASIRKAYRGGWCYNLAEQEIGEGIVLDVNSLYPSVMYSETNGVTHKYPYGIPVYYEGKYVDDKYMPLYIQHIKTSFKLKPGKLPTVQLKNSFTFGRPAYVDESEEIIDLYFTNIDLNLFLEHYHIYYIEYVDGYKFQGVMGIFDEYIDTFMTMKIKNDDNPAMRTIAKLYLNALYGKFGTGRFAKNKIPKLEKDGIIRYEMETRKDNFGNDVDYFVRRGYRVDVAAFCTAYARDVTIRTAQLMHDEGRFCYSDTDSIHLSGTEIPKNIQIDSTALGKWKHEATFEQAKFIRGKTYAEKINGEWVIKCSGMSDTVRKFLADNNIDKFDYGFNSDDYNIVGKLRPKVVKGGVVLQKQKFSINK